MAVRRFDVLLLIVLTISAFWIQPSRQDGCVVVPYSADSQNGEVSLADIEVLKCAHLRLPRDVTNPTSVITTTTLAKTPPPAAAVNQTGPEVNIPKITPKNGTVPRIEFLTPHRNLGENGTGIHLYKECNTTGPTPICVSDPIVPDEGNSTASGEINMEDFSEPQEKLLSDNNSTNVTNDTHEYYNSSFIFDKTIFESHWTNLMKSGEIKVNELLSRSHRRATTLRLQFEFPFYGQFVRNVTIATGGFIYTGDYIHSWLAATQYIAPLMGNFDTSQSNDSYVKYIDNGTALTVIWENVVLQDRLMDGKFTFAATLYDTGDLAFAYKDIPISIENIQDVQHPVKVGLSDAFIIEHVSLSVLRRKTIYEYHRLEFRNQTQHITNNTIVKLTALPSCPQHKTCSTCLQHDTAFECAWCPKARLCSIGNDRQRQEWMYLQCFEGNVTDAALCEDTKVFNTDIGDHASPPYTTTKNVTVLNAEHAASIELSRKKAEAEGDGGSAGAIVAGLIAIITAGGIMAWFLYAYRNPHTNSGQFLVKYRPSQWSWRRGEARYTAATIHM